MLLLLSSQILMNQGVQFINNTTRSESFIVENVDLLKQMKDFENFGQNLASRNNFSLFVLQFMFLKQEKSCLNFIITFSQEFRLSK